MRARRSIVTRLGAAFTAAVLLAGCASIPDSGPVQEGVTTIAEEDTILPLAEGPVVGATQEAIVNGFLRALAQGFNSDFSVAREYLTADASRDWDPSASTTVFGSGALTPEWSEDGTTAAYTVPVAATIDGDGRLVEAADGAEAILDFTLVQEDGEWRIDDLEDGALLAEANFESLFRRVGLVFATADGSTEVIESRWFPRQNVATSAAQELVLGPSAWLSDAVMSGFSTSASLEVDSVVVTDGVAAVRLASDAATAEAQEGLAVVQLQRTLSALPDVTSVEVTVGGVPADASGYALGAAEVPSEVAATIVGSRLGLWDGTELKVTSDEAGALPARARGLALSYSGDQVAFLVGGSRLVVTDVLAGGMAELVDASADGAEPTGSLETTTVVEGTALVDPSYDVDGWLWTAEAGGGAVMAYPTAAAGGDPVTLEAEWLQARRIRAVAVSRDGARLLIASTVAGQPVLEVTGLVRDESGTPVALTEPLQVGVSSSAIAEVAWVDSTTVAALGVSVDGGTTPVWLSTVGGFTETMTAPVDSSSLTARSGTTSLTVVDPESGAQARSGSGWTSVVSGVDELAYAG
ncbi:LpqB family beta-propeller domain-containing protein [Demequina salsinemoris]|uniref:LpqB family beta-propeller domain-containing protein n=1 Tax=Demequina salsinemoris TaxID=577470 RepID=UPI000785010C|nr:LpqB family beta-propeller domain-containing protein [Demequina salsinemoris]